jgi:NhaP-type Na+/H+ or K+/H+ antiporter
LFAVAAAAGTTGHSSADHLREAVMEIGIGALAGAVVGFLAGRLVERSRDQGWADRALLPIATLAVPLLCFYGADAMGGNGFIAAFVSGISYAVSQVSVADLHETVGLTGLTSTFLGYAVWMVFGVVAVSDLERLLSWQNLLYAALSLTVLRMVPVALALLGSGLRAQTVAFVGWFGPRGMASIIFALIAFESLDADAPVSQVLSVIATTILLSVLAHGLTASPWSERYGSWANRIRPALESADTVEPLRRHGSSPRTASREGRAT